MSPARVLALAGRILNQFRHDPRTVALIVIVPLTVMALMGYLISEDKEPLPVAVVNADRGTDTQAGRLVLGSEIESALARQGAVDPRPAGSEGEARELVAAGEVVGAVVLASDLTEQALAGQPIVRVLVGGTDPGIEGPVVRAVGEALSDVGRAAAGVSPAGIPGAPAGLVVDRLAVPPGAKLSTIEFYAPVLIAFYSFFFTFLLTSVSFLRERSSGTLERLMASPASRLEVLVGYLLGFIGFATVQALVVLGYSVWALDLAVAGSIWLVLVITLVLVVGVVNLGIALSFFARNELQVVQFIPIIFIPQGLLGGLIWPVETLHPALRWLSQAFPLTHAAAALRDVMVGGAGFGDVLGRFLAILAFTVAMVGVGILALRRRA